MYFTVTPFLNAKVDKWPHVLLMSSGGVGESLKHHLGRAKFYCYEKKNMMHVSGTEVKAKHMISEPKIHLLLCKSKVEGFQQFGEWLFGLAADI